MPYDNASFKAGLAVGRMLWKPPHFRESQYFTYLQCFGAQWINTGYYTTPNSRVVAIVNYEPYTARSASFLFGNRHTTIPNTAYPTEFNFSFEYGRFALNSGGTYTFAAAVTGQKIVVDCTRTTAIWSSYPDRRELGRITLQGTTPENAIAPMSIMTLTGWGTSCAMKGKVYDVRVYEGDQLVRDYRPALGRDGEACMYERMQGRYFYNLGSGSLVFGVDVDDG